MAENLGKRYTQEKKEAVLKRMMPPNNEKISAISKNKTLQNQRYISGEKKHARKELLHYKCQAYYGSYALLGMIPIQNRV